VRTGVLTLTCHVANCPTVSYFAAELNLGLLPKTQLRQLLFTALAKRLFSFGRIDLPQPHDKVLGLLALAAANPKCVAVGNTDDKAEECSSGHK
jgi:hypothetical protein